MWRRFAAAASALGIMVPERAGRGKRLYMTSDDGLMAASRNDDGLAAVLRE
jgi:hypothetical protein